MNELGGQKFSVAPGPYSRLRVVGTRRKGLRRAKSGRRHKREVVESYGREVSSRVSHGQKDYRTREPPSTRRNVGQS